MRRGRRRAEPRHQLGHPCTMAIGQDGTESQAKQRAEELRPGASWCAERRSGSPLRPRSALGTPHVLCSRTVCDAGFNVLCTYRAHKTRIQQVAHIPEKETLASIDEKGMHLWHTTDGPDDRSETIKDLRYPDRKSSFITAVTYSAHAKVLFAACLDGHLRLYKHNFKIKACLPWAESAVHDMAFVHKRDELVVAGAAGVKVWPRCALDRLWCRASCVPCGSDASGRSVHAVASQPRVHSDAPVVLALCTHTFAAAQIYYTEPDHEAYARSAKDPDEVVDYLAGTTNRWAYGQCQTMRERMSLRVPGANCVSSNVPGHARPDLGKDWVRHISVEHEADVLFVMVQASVYGYSLASGERVLTWHGVHSQRICQVRSIASCLSLSCLCATSCHCGMIAVEPPMRRPAASTCYRTPHCLDLCCLWP